MSIWDEMPIRDFPDRVFRKLLENADNLRELVTAVVPDLAPKLDFTRLEIVGREFLLEDWRGRESDLLFRIPFLSPDAERPLLVCLLLEHQSAADPRMPLRMLLYAVLYWEREWKAWEDQHERGASLRLTPVLPIVFHTGQEPWTSNRQLADLFSGPVEMRRFTPQWPALFWDLAEQSPETLLASGAAWLQSLAVVRAEEDESTAFQAVLGEVLPHLVELRSRDKIRGLDLLGFVLSWALRRRPGTERRHLIDLVQTQIADLQTQQEVSQMGKLLEKTYDQEWAEKVKVLAEARAQELAGPLAQKLAEARVQELMEARAQELAKPIAQELAKPIAQELAKPIAQELAKPIAQELAKPIAQELAKPIAQELAKPIAQELAKPIAQELAKEHDLRFLREAIRDILQDRFGTLSDSLLERIDACADMQQLKAALRQTSRIQSLDELQL